METASAKQQLLNQAADHIFTEVHLLVQAFAMRFALENWGQRLVDHLQSTRIRPDQVYAHCWNNLYQGCESDDMATGLEQERSHWRLEGAAAVKRVEAAGLPLTMRNAEDAWFGRGAFAKAAT